MSVCMALLPGAGLGVKRERYEELIDVVKVVKEQPAEKEKREKVKEMWRKRWNIERLENKKLDDHYNKSSSDTTTTTTTSGKKKKRRHLELELEVKYDDDDYFSSSSCSCNERRRKTRRRDDDDDHETKHDQFEGSSCSVSWEKKELLTDHLPVSVAVRSTSSYDSTANNYNHNNTTTTKKKKIKKEEEKEELCSTIISATSSSSSNNICWIDDDYEEATSKRSLSLQLEKEVLDYTKLELPPNDTIDESTLPPLDLDWLYPKTTKTKKDERRRGGADEGRQNCSPGPMGPPRAQYLHDLHIYALPYVLPF